MKVWKISPVAVAVGHLRCRPRRRCCSLRRWWTVAMSFRPLAVERVAAEIVEIEVVDRAGAVVGARRRPRRRSVRAPSARTSFPGSAARALAVVDRAVEVAAPAPAPAKARRHEAGAGRRWRAASAPLRRRRAASRTLRFCAQQRRAPSRSACASPRISSTRSMCGGTMQRRGSRLECVHIAVSSVHGNGFRSKIARFDAPHRTPNTAANSPPIRRRAIAAAGGPGRALG